MGNIADLYGSAVDTNQPDAATGFTPIPAGWYTVQVDSAEIRETRAKTGKFLHLELSIVGDKFAGRKLFPNINLINPNQTAMEIGQRELAAIGQACGIASLSDTDELLGSVIQARVKIKPAEGDYAEDNDVTAYKAVDGAVPTPATHPPLTPADVAAVIIDTVVAPSPGKAGKRPWDR